MTTTIPATEVKKRFDRVLHQMAKSNDPTITDQIIIVYAQLPNNSPIAQHQGQLLAQQVRQELGDSLGDSLELVMNQLRGREWLS